MRTLKSTQEKVASIIVSPRFWNIVEQKEEMLPANEDQMVSQNMEAAGLFEQTISLVGQAFTLITYQMLLRVLSMVIDNSPKVFG